MPLCLCSCPHLDTSCQGCLPTVPIRNVVRLQGFIKQGKRLRGSASPPQNLAGSGKPFGFPLDHNPARRCVPTDYPLFTRSVKRFVLAVKDAVFDSNFLFVGCLKKKMRTDKPSSLHSFIRVKGRKKIGASISPILFAKTELSYNAHYKTLPPAYASASAGFRPSGSTCLTPSLALRPQHFVGCLKMLWAWVKHNIVNVMLTSPVLFTTQGSLTITPPLTFPRPCHFFIKENHEMSRAGALSPSLRGREKVGSKYFSRREMGGGFIWMGLRSFVVGQMKTTFLVGYRRESGFYLKVGFALPKGRLRTAFWVPKRLTYASRVP